MDKIEAKKSIFLIDGSSFLYRAYYSLRPLYTIEGKAVQAVFGFCRMIKKVIDTFEPEYIAVVWDSKGKTTRHEMFADYKATRQAPPSDLFEQKELILEFLDLIGMAQVAQVGIEADDLMFSLAQDFKKMEKPSIFITSDKDMAQALDPLISIFDPFKDEFLDPQSFAERKGFPVAKLPFYFALLGDTSDNIPGVKGIGEKGATELVQNFESLADLYLNLDKVAKEKTRKALQEQQDNAFLSEKLFLLQYYPMHTSLEKVSFDANNWNNARPLFEKLNFKSMLKSSPQAESAAQAVLTQEKINIFKKYDFKAITTEQDLKDLCTNLIKAQAFAIDTETTGLDLTQDNMVGLSIAYKEGESFYIPYGHQISETQLPKEVILVCLKPILEDPAIKKYMHHAKFDQHVIYNAGITVQGVVFDSYLAANLLVKEWQRSGLKYLSTFYFNEPMLTFEEVVKDNKYKNFSFVPLELATVYAAADAHQTLKLKTILEKELHEQKLDWLFNEIDMPLVQLLFEMERNGIMLDIPLLTELNMQVTAQINAIEKEILNQIGEHNKSINLNSPKQVEELLFTQLQLPVQKKSAKGTGYSTDAEVLAELAKIHPVPPLISKFRELTKLKNTYIAALPEYVDARDGKIHTTFSQVGVATGRLASSDPNLQNIPVESFGVRAAFKPESGHVFLSVDYSQIELRVLAHISKDTNLVNAFLQGHDIHAETAARLFDLPLDKVSNEQRQVGKRINFSILYGLTPFGLSKDMDIAMHEAKKYIEKYFAQYPGVMKWMDYVIEETKKYGYVTTLWGRRRYVPAIHERNKSLYEEARRVAINTVAQGTAADIMKLGMLNLNAELKKNNLGAKILLQIHDELLISVPIAEQQKTEQLVKQVLESVVDWDVPLVVATRFGADWYQVTK